MTNRERFFAGHSFELNGQAAQLKFIYASRWLMVDDIQKYSISHLGPESFTYEIMFTPFDSSETMLFDSLKFIG